MRRSGSYVVGIDEVGRGCLAGPVVVAAVLMPANYSVPRKRLGRLRDSKRLTPGGRERWHEYFKNDGRLKYAVSKVNPRRIEKINISQAANLAAIRAFDRLLEKDGIDARRTRVFLDGGLYLGKKKVGNGVFARTVTGGDRRIRSVAIASIIAKVTRDRQMKRLSLKYPEYGFDVHKGYGTKLHYAALENFGPCEIHRLTFIEKCANIK